jgi:benzil reductase ((S)-benzoin forming)
MKLFVITGASRGLGEALVRALLQPGHHLVCVARRDNPALREAAQQAGVPLDWYCRDLADTDAAQQWTRDTLAALPGGFGMATLILNAGVVEPIGDLAALEAATLVPHLQLNLVSPMLTTAAFIQATDGWNCTRRVLAISSGAARRPIEGWSAYCAGKAGLDMFVRSINAEYAARPAGKSVRAVALAPGVIDTGMQDIIRTQEFAQVARFRDLKSQGNLASPDTVAAAIKKYLERDDFGATELDDLRK